MKKRNYDGYILFGSFFITACALYVHLRFPDKKTLFIISFIILIIFFFLTVFLLARLMKKHKTVSRVFSAFGSVVLKFARFVVKIYDALTDSGTQKIYVGGTDKARTAFVGAGRKSGGKTKIRPPKPKDIKTPSDKVRYAYIMYVRKKLKAPPASHTARTVLKSIGGEGSELMCGAYEPVRYGDAVPDENVCETVMKMI